MWICKRVQKFIVDFENSSLSILTLFPLTIFFWSCQLHGTVRKRMEFEFAQSEQSQCVQTLSTDDGQERMILSLNYFVKLKSYIKKNLKHFHFMQLLLLLILILHFLLKNIACIFAFT